MSGDRTRPAPAERFAADHLAFDLHAEIAALRSEQTLSRHGHRQKTLFKHSGATVALFVLDAGATLAEHAAGGTVIVQVIDGELEITAAGDRQRLGKGMLLVMAPGVRHDVRAPAPAAFLLQVSLSHPGEAAVGAHAPASGRETTEQRSAADRETPAAQEVPGTFKEFVRRFPALGRAHESVAKAVEEAGPLDAKTLSLIKIGICVGAGLESALRSHTRRTLEHGATPAEVEQAILLGMNTVGFPRTVAAWRWAQEQFQRGA